MIEIGCVSRSLTLKTRRKIMGRLEIEIMC